MVICGNCGKEITGIIFFCRLNEIYKKNNIHGNWCKVVFCSDYCRAEHVRNQHRFICHECGKKFGNILPYSDKHGNIFCSEECQNKFGKS